jgi:hypothetical protein
MDVGDLHNHHIAIAVFVCNRNQTLGDFFTRLDKLVCRIGMFVSYGTRCCGHMGKEHEIFLWEIEKLSYLDDGLQFFRVRAVLPNEAGVHHADQ